VITASPLLGLPIFLAPGGEPIAPHLDLKQLQCNRRGIHHEGITGS